MKGTFFKPPLEYRLEVNGDEWHQGDTISCNLVVKNRGSSIQLVEQCYLNLALGQVKKVREKDEDAFEVVACSDFVPPFELNPDAQQSFPWTFQLDNNCSVTDKKQSLYLICGSGRTSEAAGQLMVNVQPHLYIEALVSLLESSFSFVLKGIRSTKGAVEAKLKPPSGPEFPTLEQLTLSCQLTEEGLALNYNFQIKGLEAGPLNLAIKKSKKQFTQSVPFKQFLFGGEHINNEALELVVGETLATVRSGAGKRDKN